MDFTIKERLKKGRLSILSVNEKTHTKTAAVVLMIFLAAVGFSGQNSDIGNFVQQVKERATPLVSVDFLAEAKDLDVLKDLIGDAPIVCLGESQHLMSEPYQLKHRVTRFLVEEMGFTHIAIEDSFYGTLAIDDYIKGADISPEEALENTGGWYLWDTEEMLSFVHWLRSYNRRKAEEEKVSYVGIDIQDPWPGIMVLAEYFEKYDPEFSGHFEAKRQVFDVFNKPIWFQIKYGYSKLALEEKQEIEETLKEYRDRLESRREEYIRAGGEKAYRDMCLVVGHLFKSHLFFLELETAAEGEVGLREKTMFANIIRLRESPAPKAKIIVWVHNAHAAKSPVAFLNTGIPEDASLELLGTMLKRKYGDEVKSLGMASLGVRKEGTELNTQPDVLDHVLSKSGQDLCFLDFRKLNTEDGSKSFMEIPWKLTADRGGFLSLVPAEAYDGIFFIKHTSGVTLSPKSAERFKKLF